MRFCDCGTGVPLPAREPRAEDWIDSASDSSLSAVDAGEPFALAALLTLDNVDLPFGGFFRLMPPEGVVFWRSWRFCCWVVAPHCLLVTHSGCRPWACLAPLKHAWRGHWTRRAHSEVLC